MTVLVVANQNFGKNSYLRKPGPILSQRIYLPVHPLHHPEFEVKRNFMYSNNTNLIACSNSSLRSTLIAIMSSISAVQQNESRTDVTTPNRHPATSIVPSPASSLNQ